jgi:hypothetical protein
VPTLALAATAALALAAATRGSLARAPKPDLGGPPVWLTPDAQALLERVERVYASKIVLAPRAVYLLAPPARLRALLQPHAARAHQQLLVSAGMDRDLAQSYAQNVDHWDGLQAVVAALLDQVGASAPGLDWADLSVIPVPSPGHPVGPVWSVSKRTMVEGKPPKPFRFCDQPAVPMGEASGPVLLELPKVKVPLFLSHGVSIEGLEQAKACGGLLWPSFALTWRAPSSYGDVVFLADVRTISSIVKPTGKPSALKHAYLAATDIWSPTAADLEQYETAIDQQRAGNRYLGLQAGLAVDVVSKPAGDDLVGAFSYFGQSDGELTDRVDSVPKLAAHMRAILDAHGDGDPYAQRPRRDDIWPYRYPYAELKIVGRVEASSMPLCLYPDSLAGRVEPQLDALGFRGFRVPFPWSGGRRSSWRGGDGGAAEHAWAAAATSALLRWATAPCASARGQQGAAARQAGSYHPLLRLGRTAELGPPVRC